MAYVAISQQFRSDVERQIRQMRMKELGAVGDVPAVHLEGTEEFMIDLLWGEYRHLYDVTPNHWCRYESYPSFQVCIPSPEGQQWKRDVQAIVKLSFRIPPKGGAYSYTINHDVHSAFEEWTKWAVDYTECEKRWDATQDQVLKFLNACKSLNEGLKLWPDLKYYIPQQYLDKVAEKIEKKKKPSEALDALKEIDVNQIVANAVMSRMAA